MRYDFMVSDLYGNVFQIGIYPFKVNNGNTRIMFEICSKLTIRAKVTSLFFTH